MTQNLLKASLIGNAVLACALTYQWFFAGPSHIDSEKHNLAAVSAWSERELPAHLAAAVVLRAARANSEAGGDGSLNNVAYFALDEVAERYPSDEAARSAITNALGTEAARNPEFATVFKPLGRDYDYLSQEKQVALQRILHEGSTSRKGAGAPSSFEQFGEETLASVKQLLTEEEFLDFELRQSRAAHRLLLSGFPFSQEEFRQAYVALRPSSDRNSTLFPADPAEVEQKLKTILGQERYSEFVKSQDLRYRTLREFVATGEITESVAEQAFTAIREADDRAQTALSTSGARGGSANLADIFQQRDARLRELLQTKHYLVISKHLGQPTRLPFANGSRALGQLVRMQ